MDIVFVAVVINIIIIIFMYIFSLPFYRIIVPTVDTVRYNFLVSTLVDNFHPVMLVGPVGTGKTSVVSEVLNKVDPARLVYLSSSCIRKSIIIRVQFQR